MPTRADLVYAAVYAAEWNRLRGPRDTLDVAVAAREARKGAEAAAAGVQAPAEPTPVRVVLSDLVRIIECQGRLGGTARDVVLSTAFDCAKRAL